MGRRAARDRYIDDDNNDDTDMAILKDLTEQLTKHNRLDEQRQKVKSAKEIFRLSPTDENKKAYLHVLKEMLEQQASGSNDNSDDGPPRKVTAM